MSHLSGHITVILGFFGISPSYILSFSALGGILFLGGFWEDDCRLLFGNFFGGILGTSLAAGLGVLPAGLYYFGEFNIFFLLPNLMILPLAPLIIFACAGAALAPSPLWEPALGFFNGYLFYWCSFTARIPHSLVAFGNKKAASLVLVLSFLAMCIMIKKLAHWRIGHALRPPAPPRDFRNS